MKRMHEDGEPLEEDEYGDQRNMEDFVHLKDTKDFHIGNAKPLQKLVCKRCGGEEFQVGQADWFTGIRCRRCKWEAGIHEG